MKKNFSIFTFILLLLLPLQTKAITTYQVKDNTLTKQNIQLLNDQAKELKYNPFYKPKLTLSPRKIKALLQNGFNNKTDAKNGILKNQLDLQGQKQTLATNTIFLISSSASMSMFAPNQDSILFTSSDLNPNHYYCLSKIFDKNALCQKDNEFKKTSDFAPYTFQETLTLAKDFYQDIEKNYGNNSKVTLDSLIKWNPNQNLYLKQNNTYQKLKIEQETSNDFSSPKANNSLQLLDKNLLLNQTLTQSIEKLFEQNQANQVSIIRFNNQIKTNNFSNNQNDHQIILNDLNTTNANDYYLGFQEAFNQIKQLDNKLQTKIIFIADASDTSNYDYQNIKQLIEKSNVDIYPIAYYTNYLVDQQLEKVSSTKPLYNANSQNELSQVLAKITSTKQLYPKASYHAQIDPNFDLLISKDYPLVLHNQKTKQSFKYTSLKALNKAKLVVYNKQSKTLKLNQQAIDEQGLQLSYYLKYNFKKVSLQTKPLIKAKVDYQQVISNNNNLVYDQEVQSLDLNPPNYFNYQKGLLKVSFNTITNKPVNLNQIITYQISLETLGKLDFNNVDVYPILNNGGRIISNLKEFKNLKLQANSFKSLTFKAKVVLVKDKTLKAYVKTKVNKKYLIKTKKHQLKILNHLKKQIILPKTGTPYVSIMIIFISIVVVILSQKNDYR